MMKNIALIGYGNIATKHIPVFRALGCNIIASCNRSEEKNVLAFTEGQIPLVFTDYHEMITQTKPDGIILAASFWNIYTILKEIIPYKVPILTEKPTGTCLDEHIELVDLAKQYGTPVMVGLNRRHYSVINNGIIALGGRENITSVMIEWSEDPVYLKNGRKFTDELIKKRIFENIHGLDILTWIAGDITNFHTETTICEGDFKWLMNLNGKSDSGIMFNFNATWDNFVPFRVAVYAHGKRMILSPIEQCMLSIQKETTELQPDQCDLDFKSGFFRQAERFISLDFNEFSLESATKSMILAESLYSKF